MLTRKELKVLELRKQKLTQIEVAKRLKISQAAVSKFEKNAYQKIRDSFKIMELAKKMDVEVEKDDLY